MKRVVITAMGINCSLGTNVAEVADSLHASRSGIRFAEEYAERGFRSHVHGDVDVDFKELIDRKQLRFMGDAAAYAYLAMEECVKDSGLEPDQVTNPRTGLIVGSGGASTEKHRARCRSVAREGCASCWSVHGDSHNEQHVQRMSWHGV